MRLISDVHGAVEALAAAASQPGPLLILGDLINFIDYRNNDGIVTDVSGREFTDQMVALRTSGEGAAATELWRTYHKGREAELRLSFNEAIESAYDEILPVLAGATSYVTFGNADRPDVLRSKLPEGARFVDGDVVEIEGLRVGFAGGGIHALGTPGEVTEDAMASKLAAMGDVDVLCTHVPPAVEALHRDVVGGRPKGSQAVLDYVLTRRPRWHYFGDVHQPQAVKWRVGDTACRNLGYFRATGRAWVHA